MVTKTEDVLSTTDGGKKGKTVSRRSFLKASAAAAAVAAALAAGCRPSPTPTLLPTATPTPTPSPTPMPTPTPPPAPVAEAYIFFNQSEAATVKAIFARLIPGSAQDPGAAEAGAHIYIDHALGGYYSKQQETYRRGLAAVDAYSQSQYNNGFVKLTPTQQDAVLSDMEDDKATGFYGPGAAAFFATLVQHAREGIFCDPLYGGNQNLAGWKMIGFPGAQVGYGDTQMRIGADQSKISPILTLAQEETIPMPAPSGPSAGF